MRFSPNDEIEVTPAMVHAALKALRAHNLVDSLEIGEPIMTEILKAALSERRAPKI